MSAISCFSSFTKRKIKTRKLYESLDRFSIKTKAAGHMATKKTMQSHLLVAAFDFGTTYSGYAFSFRNNPTKIVTNHGWNAGSEKLISLKTPTCILLTPDKKFDSFGYDAENKYAELAEDNKHQDWLLFRRFKMLLHNNEGLSRTSTVEDISGNIMPAMQIFAMAIGYLRDHLLHILDSQVNGLDETDILFVITVPAIWNDNAKQFMREAAIEAGLDAARLKLSLEPETASIWCQTMDLKSSFLSVGSQFMVVDLGGGTVDISIHKKRADGSLKELHRPSGGPWGGTAVDRNYINWLKRLFGETTIKRFEEEQMADYFDMLRQFELKKRSISSDTKGLVTFRLAVSLKQIYDEVDGTNLKKKLVNMDLENHVTYVGDKLRIDAFVVRSWFREPIDNILVHIKELFEEKKIKHIKKMLLVGGFAECQLVQEKLRSELQNKTIVVPEQPALAVLNGAVTFGQSPTIISSRIMKYTYGIAACDDFDENVHPKEEMKSDHAGNRLVDTLFEVFVAAGDDVPVGYEVTRTCMPTDQNISLIPVFCTANAEPRFITEPDCREIGVLEVNFAHEGGQSLEENAYDVTLVFGETELIVKAKILRTNHEFYTELNCLR